MRTIAALLVTLPFVAAAQTPPPPSAPPQTWVTEPPPASASAQPAAQPAAAEPAAPQPTAQPTGAEPAPAQPAPAAAPPPAAAYPPPPQAAPPAPQYAPPAPAPQQAARAARPPKTREGWYIGFGIGGGDGRVANEIETTNFEQLHQGGRTNVFMNFKAGATLTPKLLLGGDMSMLVSGAEAAGISTSLGILNMDAVLTFFPTGRGFFVRGGAGLSSISYTRDTPFGDQEGSASGLNVMGGVGYAFWLGGQFNLTANLDFSRQGYGESDDLDIDDSQFWSLWVGFDWY